MKIALEEDVFKPRIVSFGHTTVSRTYAIFIKMLHPVKNYIQMNKEQVCMDSCDKIDPFILSNQQFLLFAQICKYIPVGQSDL